MLVLTRRVDGHGITLRDESGQLVARVTVEAIRGGKVGVGIEAPASISIERDEIAAARGGPGHG